MNVQLFFVVVVFCTLVELAASVGGFRDPYDIYQQTKPDSSVIIAYNRSTEIEKHCSPFLASASELKPDDNRGGRLRNELSFFLGDWKQENDGAPLMQLDDEGIPESSQSLTTSPLKLVSFEVKDVNPVQHLKNAVSLGGILSLGITKNSSFAFRSGIDSMNPGSSVMAIVFEGVYMETKENGGESLLCLLGSSTSTPSSDRCESEEFSESASSNGNPYNYRPQVHFLEDDQILLVLRYPKTFKLTKRAIHGEMVSLNKQGSSSYFSKVYISSHLTCHMKYQFSSELFESRKFDPSLYQDELMEDGAMMFTGEEFCAILDSVSREALNIIPNFRFNDTYLSQIHGKLGPFLLGKDLEVSSGLIYDNIMLVFQHIKCEQDTTSIRTDKGNAKVLAVLKAFPRESSHFEELRTGLSGLTLTAEGMWDSSSGQLLMVGCQGRIDSGMEGCDYEIAMYFPRAVTITQRSFLSGRIYSFKRDIGLDNPLLFEAMTSSTEFPNRYHCPATYHNLSYSYSKIKLVNQIQSRTLPNGILTTVRQLFFQYPALKDGGVPLDQLSMLASSLGLDSYVVSDHSDQFIDVQKWVLIQVEVLSLGPILLGQYDPTSDKRMGRNEPIITIEDFTRSRFLNVSMHLVFRTNERLIQTNYKNISELFMEGLYDTTLGEMHLIGCRKALVESIGIERGQDCMIEVKIQYPAINFQWRKYPSAKVIISSQRLEDDPLYFSLISLDASLTHSARYFGTAAAANQVYLELIVCILILVGSIAIIWSQLLYMKADSSIVPHISTYMLAFQMLGYCLPLISGAKVLLKSKDSRVSGDHPALGMLKFVESIQNALLLMALLLTARLYQMVTESRKRPRPEGSRNGASKKRVILGFIAICTFNHLIWLATLDIPAVNAQHNPDVDMHGARSVNMLQQFWMSIIEDIELWKSIIEEIVYELQDLFLVPQVLLNLSMQTPVKSLRKAYYLGFASIRLLVHCFDHIRYHHSSHSYSISVLLSKAASPTTKLLLPAIIVFIQQNRKHQKRRLLF
ncbi:hypothetical protein COLO4_34968 [Corchorus olitorius]|uniref:RING-type E3 ubiquitin transferase n=1 Tax=Corchorus olitorius TaxID=93759 RepID=A0A1R3GIN1_9ROSI|nr:hypothetical protein COLO4_34968 [Corchorus olitorius]